MTRRKRFTPDEDPYRLEPLLSEHQIYVAGEDVPLERLEHFVRLFRATWQRMPAAVCDQILNGVWAPWRDAIAAAGPHRVTGRVLQFAPVRLIGKFWRGGRGAAATTGLGGREVCFKARYLADTPDIIAAELIAHELAHVYQHAAGYRGALVDAEADAHRLVTAWGFFLGRPGKVARENGPMAVAVAEELRARVATVEKGGA